MKRAVVIGVGVAVMLVVGVLALRHSSTTANTTASAFDLPALNGTGRVTLAAHHGHPVVVNLFASWCTECKEELPAFAHVAKDLRGKVDFIGVNSMETGDGRGMAAQYDLAGNGFFLARDVGNGLHTSYRAPGMPVTVLYDADGHEVFRDIASIPEATLRAQLKQYFGV